MAIMLDKAKREIAGVSVSSKETEVGLPENRPFPDSEHESVSVPFSENNRKQLPQTLTGRELHQRQQPIPEVIRDNAWE